MPIPRLPQYLRMFRKRSGLSQGELAFLLGTKSGSKVSRYEAGNRTPAFEALLAYEIVFRVALDELFAGRHDTARSALRVRAQRLMRTLDSERFTPSVKRKMDFLAELINPPQDS